MAIPACGRDDFSRTQKDEVGVRALFDILNRAVELARVLSNHPPDPVIVLLRQRGFDSSSFKVSVVSLAFAGDGRGGVACRIC